MLWRNGVSLLLCLTGVSDGPGSTEGPSFAKISSWLCLEQCVHSSLCTLWIKSARSHLL